MTVDEVRKYAEEKGFGKRFIDGYIRDLERSDGEIRIDENGNVTYPCMVTLYIDSAAERWETMRRIIKRNREEREKRKESIKAKAGEK